MAETTATHKLIVGDFNYPNIDWDLQSADDGPEKPGFEFVKILQDNFLFQHRVKPTRFREGQRPSTLDLIITNEEGMYTEIEDAPPLGRSDHICQVFGFRCYTSNQSSQPSRPIYDKGNYEKMRHDLNQENWEGDMSNMNVEEAWNHFHKRLLKITEEHVPLLKAQEEQQKITMDEQGRYEKSEEKIPCMEKIPRNERWRRLC